MSQQNSSTVVLALFVALSIVLVTGLVAIPAMEEAEAKCTGFKKNGKPCNPKHNV